MDFLLSSIVNELNLEILYITSNYDKEMLSDSDISKLKDYDLKKVSDDKNLNKMVNLFKDYLVRANIFSFSSEILDIMLKHEYDLSTFKKVINYLNKYVDEYKKGYLFIESKVKDILNDVKEGESYKGIYPVYLSVKENNLTIERYIITTNAKSILYKSNNTFSFKVTKMSYNIALSNYSYDGINLLNLSKDEIFKMLDSKVKIDMNKTNYSVTNEVLIKLEDNKIIIPNTEQLKENITTYTGKENNIKIALKESLKRTGVTLLIIIIITLGFILIKYLG